MDIIAKDSGGQNVVAREQALPRWQPAATVPAALVEIYRSDPGQPAAAPAVVAVSVPGGEVLLHYNPDKDRNVVFRNVSVSASGTRSVMNVDDGVAATLIHRRETEAPTIGQHGAATAESVEIGITGFTRFARQRRVTVWDNAERSGEPLTTILFNSDSYVERQLPLYFVLTRLVGTELELAAENDIVLATEDHGTELPLSVWITVAHSGGNGWTPESNVLGVTFAGGDGTGGSEGGFDPIPRDKSRLEMAEV